MQLVKAIDQMTSNSPTEERYGLAQQMRRAAVSTPGNIAEGAGRNSAKEFLSFIGISRGSLAELETQLQLAIMRGFAAPEHPAFELAYAPESYSLSPNTSQLPAFVAEAAPSV